MSPSVPCALQVLKSSALAEDAVHDAFLKLIKHFSEIRKISCKELEPFVVIIVKRTALDLLKQEKRLTSLEDGWDPPAGSGPETETAYHRLVELIRSMPDTYREVLELRCVLEWSNKDIARRLSLSENAVAVRLMRGKPCCKTNWNRRGTAVKDSEILTLCCAAPLWRPPDWMQSPDGG
jgi:RNA polymerase sigma-70 factor (ECF subfamily)